MCCLYFRGAYPCRFRALIRIPYPFKQSLNGKGRDPLKEGVKQEKVVGTPGLKKGLEVEVLKQQPYKRP